MKKAGIACPTVALLKKHILVMSFIGKDQQPAPKLKDAVLSPRQLQLAYEQCVQVQSDLIRVFVIVWGIFKWRHEVSNECKTFKMWSPYSVCVSQNMWPYGTVLNYNAIKWWWCFPDDVHNVPEMQTDSCRSEWVQHVVAWKQSMVYRRQSVSGTNAPSRLGIPL